MTDDYLDWIADRNAAEALWQTNINAAHALQAGSQAAARQTLAVNNAAAAQARDTSLANARFTYVAALTAPAKTYVDATALAQRNYAVNVATALRNYTLDESQQREQTYQDALNNALSGKNSSIGAAEGAYKGAQGSALSTRWTTETNARHSYSFAVATETMNHEVTIVNSLYDFEVAEEIARVALVSSQSLIDKEWRFQTPNATPWRAGERTCARRKTAGAGGIIGRLTPPARRAGATTGRGNVGRRDHLRGEVQDDPHPGPFPEGEGDWQARCPPHNILAGGTPTLRFQARNARAGSMAASGSCCSVSE
jgi:hypothetical protein